MPEVTRILSAIEHGEPHAAEQLLPLVYDELRKLAAANLAQETPGQTLDATSLVHEAYLRLVGDASDRQFTDRQHFFRVAAKAMRRILVDRAREKRSQKRGGVWKRSLAALVLGGKTRSDSWFSRRPRATAKPCRLITPAA